MENTLLILCGETELTLNEFNNIVTFCPIRHFLMQKEGINNFRFSDFKPDHKLGKDLDLKLHETLDHCLHQEAEINPTLKWAPLAIQQVKWRLSRYLWLKKCFRNIIKKFTPTVQH